MIPGKCSIDDEATCVELARFRLPGEGPHRTVIIARTSQGGYVFRGDGQTRQEADRKAAVRAIVFIRSHGLAA
jgi:hypothetical protein